MRSDLAKTLAELAKALVQTRYEGGIGEFLKVCRLASSHLMALSADLRTGKLIALPDDVVEVAIAEGLIMELDMDEDDDSAKIERVAKAIAVRVLAALIKGADHA